MIDTCKSDLSCHCEQPHTYKLFSEFLLDFLYLSCILSPSICLSLLVSYLSTQYLFFVLCSPNIDFQSIWCQADIVLLIFQDICCIFMGEEFSLTINNCTQSIGMVQLFWQTCFIVIFTQVLTLPLSLVFPYSLETSLLTPIKGITVIWTEIHNY